VIIGYLLCCGSVFHDVDFSPSTPTCYFVCWHWMYVRERRDYFREIGVFLQNWFSFAFRSQVGVLRILNHLKSRKGLRFWSWIQFLILVTLYSQSVSPSKARSLYQSPFSLISPELFVPFPVSLLKALLSLPRQQMSLWE